MSNLVLAENVSSDNPISDNPGVAAPNLTIVYNERVEHGPQTIVDGQVNTMQINNNVRSQHLFPINCFGEDHFPEGTHDTFSEPEVVLANEASGFSRCG